MKRSRSVSVSIALAALIGCAINPVTGERELALISPAQEVELGRESARQIEAQLGLADDPALEAYVAGIGMALAEDSERPDLPWEFSIVDDPAPNAFALPGGFIFVTRGLLALLESEAELAAVLGHEIGHVTARHSVNQISRAQLAQIGLALGAATIPELEDVGGLAMAGLELLFLKHGRDDERQSDRLGFDYMLSGGYDVREMDDVFAALQSSGELAGASPLPSWLASHPNPPDRIEAARARTAAAEPLPDGLLVNADRYLNAIDGLVYGQDPREGYFEGDWFYHPELEFRLEIPESWQRRNLSSAVVAASPERDAALELTLAQGSPSEAAARFFMGQAIQRTGARATRINGFDAVVSSFRAAAGGGVVQGMAAHLAINGATLQLLTYAPEAAAAGRAALFNEIIASVDAVRDRDVLDVGPARVQIVTIERAMTLREFAERYPSAVPLEELAVINQATPDAQLPEGARVKRVVG